MSNTCCVCHQKFQCNSGYTGANPTCIGCRRGFNKSQAVRFNPVRGSIPRASRPYNRFAPQNNDSSSNLEILDNTPYSDSPYLPEQRKLRFDKPRNSRFRGKNCQVESQQAYFIERDYPVENQDLYDEEFLSNRPKRNRSARKDNDNKDKKDKKNKKGRNRTKAQKTSDKKASNASKSKANAQKSRRSQRSRRFKDLFKITSRTRLFLSCFVFFFALIGLDYFDIKEYDLVENEDIYLVRIVAGSLSVVLWILFAYLPSKYVTRRTIIEKKQVHPNSKQWIMYSCGADGLISHSIWYGSKQEIGKLIKANVEKYTAILATFIA